jgi:acyl-CoA thioesterase-1
MPTLSPAALACTIAQALARRLCALLLLVLIGSATALAAPEGERALLVVGDSVSAGYGLANGQGWVNLLATRLADERYPYRVVNASISGDTTAGGRARLPALLAQHQPAIVIIELGGNDALRGGRLDATRANLDAMAAAAQTSGARVMIVGMQVPSNYGPTYVRDFAALFGEVARQRKAAFVPFLFAGFGEDLAFFQPDRIHPTAGAQAKMLDNVWPALRPLLGKPR